MKKIIILVAALGLLMACGGNSKKAELTVEQKAVSYMEQLMDAELAGDAEKVTKLEAELEEWAESLSDEDEAKAQMAAEEWMMENIDKLMQLGD